MVGGGQSHFPREIRRYLIPSETIVFVLHRHWAILLEPILSTAAALIGAVVAAVQAPGPLGRLLFGIWVVLVLRLAFHVFEWHHELFLATNSRLMLVHGLITRKVDIMPMSKVTDMRYDRSLLGQILGYGVFVLESAGQDQALSRINHIPQPDLRYQQISMVLFAPADLVPQPLAPAVTGSLIPVAEPDAAWWRRP